MMASHRSTDPAPLEQPLPTENAPAARSSSDPTTLPPSGVIAGMDWVLCLAILAFAFLLASFSVRNSDFFLHLATGRLISEGAYSFGKDPFSYMGGDRNWVNHAWLYDLFLFKLFSAAGGPAVVIAKAIFIGLAAGLLLVARRVGQSVFPSIICVGLAVVAASPRFFLQPTIGSMFAVAILMTLLVRMPKVAGSWRFPICVSVLFCLWSNVDQWFFVGPAFLLLYIVGQIIRPDEGVNLGTLWKALLLGVLACMVNPHHYHIWMLPPELADQTLKKVLANDVEMGGMFQDAFSKGSLDFSGDRVVPTYLYFLVALLGLTVLGFATNLKHLSVGLALVWGGAVALALFHLRAIPFLAFVSAPVAAINLAMALKRLTDVPRTERTIRIFLAVRALGRGLAIFAVLVMIALSYPGWLYSSTQSPRNWAWEVESNSSMRRTAEQLREWHQSGLLPAEARMLNLQPDFAHYAAWYAPEIKSYFDVRLRFHRDEATAYAALRKHLAPRIGPNPSDDEFDMDGFLRSNGITYVVTSHAGRSWNEAVISNLMGGDPTRAPQWEIWNIAGRGVVLGWTRQGTIPKKTFDRLKFDPLREAYAEATPIAEPDLRVPLTPQNGWERYLMVTPMAPAEGEESFLLLRFRDVLLNKIAIDQRGHWIAMHLFGQRLMMPALNVWTLVPLQSQNAIPFVPPPEINAIALLAVRAARKAITESPDHPDGYFYLSLAYPMFMAYEFASDVEQFVTVGSLARARKRLPADSAQRRSLVYSQEVLERLRQAHMTAGPQRLDLWLEEIRLATEDLRVYTEELEGDLIKYEGEELKRRQEEVDLRTRRLKVMTREVENLDTTVQKNRLDYVNVVAGMSSPLDRASVARRFGLVREAIEELEKAHKKFQDELGTGKTFPPRELAQHLANHSELIELLIYDGQVERAAQILGTMDDANTLATMESKEVVQEYAAIRQRALRQLNPNNPSPSPFDVNPAARFRSLRLGISMVLGDFQRAAEVQAYNASMVRKDLEAFQKQHFPKELPDTTNVPTRNELIMEAFHYPVRTALTFARQEYSRKVNGLLALTQSLAQQQTRLGMTYLEQGNVPLAAIHFRLALDAAKWKTPFPSQRLAREFLKAIEKAGVPQGVAQ